MDYTLLLRGLLIGWWVSNFIPLQNLLTKAKPYLYFEYLKSGISCFKCLSLWIVLLMTMDIYAAIAAAVIAYTFERIMNGIKTYL